MILVFSCLSSRLHYLFNTTRPLPLKYILRLHWKYSVLLVDTGIMHAASHILPGLRKPKLLDQVRLALRTKHDRLRSEQASVPWIRRFILLH